MLSKSNHFHGGHTTYCYQFTSISDQYHLSFYADRQTDRQTDTHIQTHQQTGLKTIPCTLTSLACRVKICCSHIVF